MYLGVGECVCIWVYNYSDERVFWCGCVFGCTIIRMSVYFGVGEWVCIWVYNHSDECVFGCVSGRGVYLGV